MLESLRFKVPSSPIALENAMKTIEQLRPWALSLVILGFSVLTISAQSFTLEQVMSSPFPSDLVATKRGDRIAWAFDAEGKRNIWTAEAPTFAARQLTHYDSDDGGELTDLVFAPNGNLIAFARGNEQGKNQAGEYANPPPIRQDEERSLGSRYAHGPHNQNRRGRGTDVFSGRRPGALDSRRRSPDGPSHRRKRAEAL
jgi:hypothetical protein